VERRDHHAGLLPPVISVITITGIGDHLQPEWLITFTGMRTIVINAITAWASPAHTEVTEDPRPSNLDDAVVAANAGRGLYSGCGWFQ
jgi:hypothetical protein